MQAEHIISSEYSVQMRGHVDDFQKGHFGNFKFSCQRDGRYWRDLLSYYGFRHVVVRVQSPSATAVQSTYSVQYGREGMGACRGKSRLRSSHFPTSPWVPGQAPNLRELSSCSLQVWEWLPLLCISVIVVRGAQIGVNIAKCCLSGHLPVFPTMMLGPAAALMPPTESPRADPLSVLCSEGCLRGPSGNAC